MKALAQGGDVNAALQIYREFVTLLRADPKAAPDKETSALYTRLRAEAKQQGSRQQDGPAADQTSAPPVSGYLPHPLTDLVGREDECLEVAANLRRSRLLTLTGPGGIGKTRLALAVAADVATEYPDGTWLVALDALADGYLVAPQIAKVLGIQEESGRTPLESLADHLKAKRVLLVLDNCEHLLAASAHTVGYLLRECSGLRVLSTSREALAITGETVWGVPGLGVPPDNYSPSDLVPSHRDPMNYGSVRLFVERAQAVQRHSF